MSPEMNSTRPDDVNIVADWGFLELHVDPDLPKEMYVEGNHCMLEGSEESFKKWLGQYKGIWVGKGSPMMQEFEVRHIT